MMKFGLSLLMVLLSVVTYAQFEIGPRVGIATAYTDVETTSDNITSGDADFGFSAGLFTRFGSKKVKLMPELLYSTSNSSVVFNEGEVDQQVVDSELNRIDLPVALQYHPVKLFHLQGGLVGSYLIEENNGLGDNTEEAFTNFNDFTLGYQAGLGFNLGNFIIDLKYESSMSDITDGNGIGGFEYDERQSMVKGMLGIKLF